VPWNEYNLLSAGQTTWRSAITVTRNNRRCDGGRGFGGRLKILVEIQGHCPHVECCSSWLLWHITMCSGSWPSMHRCAFNALKKIAHVCTITTCKMCSPSSSLLYSFSVLSSNDRRRHNEPTWATVYIILLQFALGSLWFSKASKSTQWALCCHSKFVTLEILGLWFSGKLVSFDHCKNSRASIIKTVILLKIWNN
jgi:hypothetical protein